jgi:CheY-like chemotaxis protein
MGKKILLADDSITIQKVIELTFSDEDFDVVTVGNGRLAIEKAQEVRPDIVLCDIIMPEKDGYEVCDFIKRHPTLHQVPVLLLTGAFEPFDQERATRVGCDGFLAKPFEPQTLIAKVKDLLAQAGARRPVAATMPSATRPLTGPIPPPAPVPPPPPVAAAPAPRPVPPPPPAVLPSAFPPPPPPAAPAFMAPPPSFQPEGREAAEAPSFIPEEPVVEDAMAATFADAMELEPEPLAEARAEAPMYTVDEGAFAPAAFEPEPAAFAPDEDLMAVTAEESDTLAASVGEALSASPSLPASQPSHWGQQPTVDVPLEARAQASASMTEAEGLFEEVFEDEVTTSAPVAPQPPPPATLPPPPPAPRAAGFVTTPPEAPEPEVPTAEMSFADLRPAEPPPPPPPSPVAASVAAEVAVPMDMVEKIAQRVVAQISEKVVREIAWEVIPDLAEALIKKEIERLKAELQQLQ